MSCIRATLTSTSANAWAIIAANGSNNTTTDGYIATIRVVGTAYSGTTIFGSGYSSNFTALNYNITTLQAPSGTNTSSISYTGLSRERTGTIDNERFAGRYKNTRKTTCCIVGIISTNRICPHNCNSGITQTRKTGVLSGCQCLIPIDVCIQERHRGFICNGNLYADSKCACEDFSILRRIIISY